MSVDKNVPQIRFKGFNDSWVEEKIQELIDRQSIIGHLDGNHGELYPRSNEFSDHGIPYISANDFVSGFISFDRCKYLPLQRAQQFKKGIAKDGDILFAHNATVGPVAKLETSYDFVILSTTATYFRCDNKSLINDYFLQALSNKKFVQQYSRVMAQSTRNQVPITVQRTFTISLPENCSEQTQIGNYFQKLDSLINQHQQQHDKLSSIKKAMLEKMFPKRGETIPEIRFEGFSGEWAESDLKSLCDSFSYGLNASAKKFDGVNRYLRITDIEDETRSFDLSALTSPDADLSKSDDYLLKNGDILFARTGASVGKTYLYNDKDGKVYFAGFLIRASVNVKANPQFVFQNTLTQEYDKFVSATSQRSGQPGINAKEYAEFRLFSPDKKEQKKIGDYFQKLDTLINQHQQQITKLNNIKQACLSKMFV